MSLNIAQMRTLIIRNGHLRMEGDESKKELREALIRLRADHTTSKCHRPKLGMSIEHLAPHIKDLEADSSPTKFVLNVDMSTQTL